MPEYKTAEEFLAIQNIFMHEIGKTQFYLSHENNRVVSVDEVYANIANERLSMEVLGYYLYREPFVRHVATWKEPVCNVWRDYKLILSKSPFKKSLPVVPRP